MESHPAAELTSLILALILTAVWLVKRRRARGQEVDGSGSGAGASNVRYTSAQRLGIAAILVFLLPIFIGISSNLARGGMILFVFLFEALHLPPEVETVLLNLCSVAAMFTVLALTYLLCEAVWPEKRAPRTESDPTERDRSDRPEAH